MKLWHYYSQWHYLLGTVFADTAITVGAISACHYSISTYYLFTVISWGAMCGTSYCQEHYRFTIIMGGPVCVALMFWGHRVDTFTD